jgi:hypothetical protein
VKQNVVIVLLLASVCVFGAGWAFEAAHERSAGEAAAAAWMTQPGTAVDDMLRRDAQWRRDHPHPRAW